MRNTRISWTNITWNPLRGCSRKSPGCTNCYAETMAARFSGPGQPYHGYAEMTPAGPRWTGKIGFVANHINDPLNWRKPSRIFVNSTSDVFHERAEDSWLQEIFRIMERANWHTFQVLTKRETVMRDWMEKEAQRLRLKWPPKNVHLGVSVENQEYADIRVPVLQETRAAVRFISAEPLLGPVNIRPYLAKGGISWLIAGAESGYGARPMDEAWVRDLRDQCVQYGVKFFYKQRIGKDGKKVETPKLDGRRWTQYPTRLAGRPVAFTKAV